MSALPSPALDFCGLNVQCYGYFFYNWQTLLASMIALTAARIATRPVWEQLKLMSTQTKAMVRDILVVRIRDLESAKGRLVEPFTKIKADGWRDLDLLDTELGPPQVSAETAFHWEHEVYVALRRFESLAFSNLDEADIEAAKAAVKVAGENLASILSDIHAPESVDLHDEEHPLQADQIARLQADAETAPGRLVEGAASLDAAIRTLTDVQDRHIVRLRSKLRSVDAELV